MRFLIACLLSLVQLSALGANDEMAEVKLQILKPGQLMRVLTDGQPIWILFRSPTGIKSVETTAPKFDASGDAKAFKNQYRSIKREYFVVYGGCPDGPELPAYDENVGFSCLESCKKYDLAGRPVNSCAGTQPMRIPQHYYKDKNTVVVKVKAK
jgi:ubiquinol-cytochrome c reductase iron-sulfur subunit